MYRNISREYVDRFFALGELRLTTYRRCRDLELPETRDELEGTSRFTFASAGSSTQAIFDVGADSYLLCTSLLDPSAGKNFGADSSFCIRDVCGFARAVAAAIDDVRNIKLGECVYHQDRVVLGKHRIARRMDVAFQELMESLSPEATSEAMDALFESHRRKSNAVMRDGLGQDPYFVKESRFAGDAEFRIVWQTSRTVDEPLVVFAPGAIQFCAR